jgi:hypothetical protein
MRNGLGGVAQVQRRKLTAAVEGRRHRQNVLTYHGLEPVTDCVVAAPILAIGVRGKQTSFHSSQKQCDLVSSAQA